MPTPIPDAGRGAIEARFCSAESMLLRLCEILGSAMVAFSVFIFCA